MRSQTFWAIVLIIVGVLLLVGDLSLLIAVLFIAFGVGMIIVRPSIEEAHFSEPVGETRAASVDINLSVGEAQVATRPDSDHLIDADLVYLGSVHFAVSGEDEKRITLRQSSTPMDWLNNLFGWIGVNRKLRWAINLHPDVPTALQLQGGVGQATVDLSGLQLTDLSLQGGVGEMRITLPAPDERYQARIKGGVGEIAVRIADDADLELNISSGVGEITVDLPTEAAVQIKARTGLGKINVPRRLARVEGQGDMPLGGSGVWQTADYDSADRRITIDAEGGIGQLNFR